MELLFGQTRASFDLLIEGLPLNKNFAMPKISLDLVYLVRVGCVVFTWISAIPALAIPASVGAVVHSEPSSTSPEVLQRALIQHEAPRASTHFAQSKLMPILDRKRSA